MLLTFVVIFTPILVIYAQPDNQTVEGEASHIVTGESFPSSVSFTGYDVTNDKYYLNFTLETTKTITTETPTFKYYIDIYNSSNASIGNDGTYDTPTTVVGTASTATKDVTGKEITLSGSLTSEYRLIITVKEVTLA